jgi:hypothetical protein
VKRSHICRWLILLCLSAVINACPVFAESDKPVPIETSLCTIRQHPSRFQNKLVSFPVQFLTDGIERSLLVDDACKGGIAPFVPDSTIGREAFDKAFRFDVPATYNKAISAVWIGVFRARLGHISWTVTRYELHVREIRNMHCKCKTMDDVLREIHLPDSPPMLVPPTPPKPVATVEPKLSQ